MACKKKRLLWQHCLQSAVAAGTMTLYNFSGQCSTTLPSPSPSPCHWQPSLSPLCTQHSLSLQHVSVVAVIRCLGRCQNANGRLVNHRERERGAEGGRDRVGGGNELRCHSHSHLRRVNYVLFIIMRSTHALTTLVSNTLGYPSYLVLRLPLTFPAAPAAFAIIHHLFSWWLCSFLVFLLFSFIFWGCVFRFYCKSIYISLNVTINFFPPFFYFLLFFTSFAIFIWTSLTF